MKSFALRGLIIGLMLMLAACQGTQAPADTLDTAFEQMQRSLEQADLDNARDQLVALQTRASNDERLQQYQRRLADAYMQQGREALQRGDLDAAGKALSQARSLLPDAPALGSDVRQTLEQTQQ